MGVGRRPAPVLEASVDARRDRHRVPGPLLRRPLGHRPALRPRTGRRAPARDRGGAHARFAPPAAPLGRRGLRRVLPQHAARGAALLPLPRSAAPRAALRPGHLRQHLPRGLRGHGPLPRCLRRRGGAGRAPRRRSRADRGGPLARALLPADAPRGAAAADVPRGDPAPRQHRDRPRQEHVARVDDRRDRAPLWGRDR